MKLLAIIPARGGSKGIPRKNIKMLAGKPLIAWTIEVASQVDLIDRLIVSTEDEEIASLALELGAEVPYMRPHILAEDDTPGIAPVLHALRQLPGFDWVLLLQPTSPFRSVEDISGIIRFCVDEGANSAVSVTKASEHPFWMYRQNLNKCLEPLIPNRPDISWRQALPSALVLSGALYLARVDFIIENQGFIGSETLGYLMPESRSIDLDTSLDWDWAEYLIERGHV